MGNVFGGPDRTLRQVKQINYTVIGLVQMIVYVHRLTFIKKTEYSIQTFTGIIISVI